MCFSQFLKIAKDSVDFVAADRSFHHHGTDPEKMRESDSFAFLGWHHKTLFGRRVQGSDRYIFCWPILVM